MCNYHPAVVEGTSNVRASSFKDHRHAYAFCMGTGGIGRSKFKLDRTNLALYWQLTVQLTRLFPALMLHVPLHVHVLFSCLNCDRTFAVLYMCKILCAAYYAWIIVT